MSCDHMYVTQADKALNMCGLCGVTFDEWREGKVSTFRDGVMAERERIIKLLTTGSIEMLDFYSKKILLSPLEAHRGYDADIDDEQLIALIKGEK